MILRLLNIQGIAGLAASLALGLLLLIQKGETSHWKKESGRFERLYLDEQSALAGTLANIRAATAAARAADKASAERVEAEQSAISQRTSNDYEARLAAARALALRLRGQGAAAAADPGRRGAAPVPGLPAPAGGPDEAAGQDRLPDSERQLATEQAIQLDELIKWVRAQASVQPNAQNK
jgi:hypothetical protein